MSNFGVCQLFMSQSIEPFFFNFRHSLHQTPNSYLGVYFPMGNKTNIVLHSIHSIEYNISDFGPNQPNLGICFELFISDVHMPHCHINKNEITKNEGERSYSGNSMKFRVKSKEVDYIVGMNHTQKVENESECASFGV